MFFFKNMTLILHSPTLKLLYIIYSTVLNLFTKGKKVTTVCMYSGQGIGSFTTLGKIGNGTDLQWHKADPTGDCKTYSIYEYIWYIWF